MNIRESHCKRKKKKLTLKSVLFTKFAAKHYKKQKHKKSSPEHKIITITTQCDNSKSQEMTKTKILFDENYTTTSSLLKEKQNHLMKKMCFEQKRSTTDIIAVNIPILFGQYNT